MDRRWPRKNKNPSNYTQIAYFSTLPFALTRAKFYETIPDTENNERNTHMEWQCEKQQAKEFFFFVFLLLSSLL